MTGQAVEYFLSLSENSDLDKRGIRITMPIYKDNGNEEEK